MMHKQSNTPLYVVGGCVLAIAAIVAVIRANAPPEEKKEKSGPSLSDLQLAALGAPSASGDTPAPAGSDDVGRVQMLPITVEGKQGLLVRYRTEILLEPVQQKMAANILSKVKGRAEEVGVEVIVIMAVGPGGKGKAGDLAAQTHTIAYKRVGNTWVEIEDPTVSPTGSGSALPAGSAPPPASGSAPKPAGSIVPLIISH